MANRSKTVFIVAAALATALLVATLVWRKYGPQVVPVQHPTRGPAVEAVYATGTVEPSVMLPIAPRVAGRLTELKVDEGAFVKKAQVLARLEDQDLKNSVVELETRAQWAKDQYERAKMLVERGVGAANDRDRAKADWDAAAAAAAKSRVQRSYMALLAPADGQILRRDGEVGQLISVGQAVFYLSCCAPLRVSAEVDEEDIATVRPGQRVLIRADAFAGQVFEGTVGEITPKGDPVARSYRVRVKFGADTPLRIGMTVETNIVIAERQNALLVPAAAVIDGKVWLVRADRLERRELHTGVIGARQTEILQGLSMEDWVVTQPDPTLKAGRKVRPTMAPGATVP